jgi:uncharacterized beta barrel domain-containing protein DUF5777
MNKIALIIILFVSFISYSQEDLLNELDKEVKIDSAVTYAFKGLKIVNLESTKLVAKKDFYLVIAHRFGSVKGGIKELFGLDESSARFSFIFGVSDGLNFGISRSSINKTYDITAKYKLLQQKENGFPFTVVGFNSVAINTGIDSKNFSNFEFKHRLTYLAELLISRKINNKLSLQITPVFFHENYVENNSQENTQYALGGGGRYKISKYVTLNMDYAYHLNRAKNSLYNNPFSIGFDVETGGHIFQIHFTNSQLMYDSGFLTNAAGDWSEGDFFFGFNLSRVF